MDLEEIFFPWLKVIRKKILRSFPVVKEKTLHKLLQYAYEELKNLEWSDTYRAEILYETLRYFYLHLSWKITWNKDSCVQLYCVHLLYYITYVALILSNGNDQSPWLNKAVSTLNVFSDNSDIICDILLLIRNIPSKYLSAYKAILQFFLIERNIKDPDNAECFIKIMLLFRRFKCLVMVHDTVKRADIYHFASKIKCPVATVDFLSAVNKGDEYCFTERNIIRKILDKKVKNSFIKNLFEILIKNRYDEKLLNFSSNVKKKSKSALTIPTSENNPVINNNESKPKKNKIGAKAEQNKIPILKKPKKKKRKQYSKKESVVSGDTRMQIPITYSKEQSIKAKVNSHIDNQNCHNLPAQSKEISRGLETLSRKMKGKKRTLSSNSDGLVNNILSSQINKKRKAINMVTNSGEDSVFKNSNTLSDHNQDICSSESNFNTKISSEDLISQNKETHYTNDTLNRETRNFSSENSLILNKNENDHAPEERVPKPEKSNTNEKIITLSSASSDKQLIYGTSHSGNSAILFDSNLINNSSSSIQNLNGGIKTKSQHDAHTKNFDEVDDEECIPDISESIAKNSVGIYIQSMFMNEYVPFKADENQNEVMLSKTSFYDNAKENNKNVEMKSELSNDKSLSTFMLTKDDPTGYLGINPSCSFVEPDKVKGDNDLVIFPEENICKTSLFPEQKVHSTSVSSTLQMVCDDYKPFASSESLDENESFTLSENLKQNLSEKSRSIYTSSDSFMSLSSEDSSSSQEIISPKEIKRKKKSERNLSQSNSSSYSDDEVKGNEAKNLKDFGVPETDKFPVKYHTKSVNFNSEIFSKTQSSSDSMSKNPNEIERTKDTKSETLQTDVNISPGLNISLLLNEHFANSSGLQEIVSTKKIKRRNSKRNVSKTNSSNEKVKNNESKNLDSFKVTETDKISMSETHDKIKSPVKNSTPQVLQTCVKVSPESKASLLFNEDFDTSSNLQEIISPKNVKSKRSKKQNLSVSNTVEDRKSETLQMGVIKISPESKLCSLSNGDFAETNKRNLRSRSKIIVSTPCSELKKLRTPKSKTLASQRLSIKNTNISSMKIHRRDASAEKTSDLSATRLAEENVSNCTVITRQKLAKLKKIQSSKENPVNTLCNKNTRNVHNKKQEIATNYFPDSSIDSDNELSNSVNETIEALDNSTCDIINTTVNLSENMSSKNTIVSEIASFPKLSSDQSPVTNLSLDECFYNKNRDRKCEILLEGTKCLLNQNSTFTEKSTKLKNKEIKKLDATLEPVSEMSSDSCYELNESKNISVENELNSDSSDDLNVSDHMKSETSFNLLIKNQSMDVHLSKVKVETVNSSKLSLNGYLDSIKKEKECDALQGNADNYGNSQNQEIKKLNKTVQKNLKVSTESCFELNNFSKEDESNNNSTDNSNISDNITSQCFNNSSIKHQSENVHLSEAKATANSSKYFSNSYADFTKVREYETLQESKNSRNHQDHLISPSIDEKITGSGKKKLRQQLIFDFFPKSSQIICNNDKELVSKSVKDNVNLAAVGGPTDSPVKTQSDALQTETEVINYKSLKFSAINSSQSYNEHTSTSKVSNSSGPEEDETNKNACPELKCRKCDPYMQNFDLSKCLCHTLNKDVPISTTNDYFALQDKKLSDIKVNESECGLSMPIFTFETDFKNLNSHLSFKNESLVHSNCSRDSDQLSNSGENQVNPLASNDLHIAIPQKSGNTKSSEVTSCNINDLASNISDDVNHQHNLSAKSNFISSSQSPVSDEIQISASLENTSTPLKQSRSINQLSKANRNDPINGLDATSNRFSLINKPVDETKSCQNTLNLEKTNLENLAGNTSVVYSINVSSPKCAEISDTELKIQKLVKFCLGLNKDSAIEKPSFKHQTLFQVSDITKTQSCHSFTESHLLNQNLSIPETSLKSSNNLSDISSSIKISACQKRKRILSDSDSNSFDNTTVKTISEDSVNLKHATQNKSSRVVMNLSSAKKKSRSLASESGSNTDGNLNIAKDPVSYVGKSPSKNISNASLNFEHDTQNKSSNVVMNSSSKKKSRSIVSKSESGTDDNLNIDKDPESSVDKSPSKNISDALVNFNHATQNKSNSVLKNSSSAKKESRSIASESESVADGNLNIDKDSKCSVSKSPSKNVSDASINFKHATQNKSNIVVLNSSSTKKKLRRLASESESDVDGNLNLDKDSKSFLSKSHSKNISDYSNDFMPKSDSNISSQKHSVKHCKLNLDAWMKNNGVYTESFIDFTASEADSDDPECSSASEGQSEQELNGSSSRANSHCLTQSSFPVRKSQRKKKNRITTSESDSESFDDKKPTANIKLTKLIPKKNKIASESDSDGFCDRNSLKTTTELPTIKKSKSRNSKRNKASSLKKDALCDNNSKNIKINLSQNSEYRSSKPSKSPSNDLNTEIDSEMHGKHNITNNYFQDNQSSNDMAQKSVSGKGILHSSHNLSDSLIQRQRGKPKGDKQILVKPTILLPSFQSPYNLRRRKPHSDLTDTVLQSVKVVSSDHKASSCNSAADNDLTLNNSNDEFEKTHTVPVQNSKNCNFNKMQASSVLKVSCDKLADPCSSTEKKVSSIFNVEKYSAPKKELTSNEIPLNMSNNDSDMYSLNAPFSEKQADLEINEENNTLCRNLYISDDNTEMVNKFCDSMNTSSIPSRTSKSEIGTLNNTVINWKTVAVELVNEKTEKCIKFTINKKHNTAKNLKQIKGNSAKKIPSKSVTDSVEKTFSFSNTENENFEPSTLTNTAFSDSFECVSPTEIQNNFLKHSVCDLSECISPTQIQKNDLKYFACDSSECVSSTCIQNGDKKNSDLSECASLTQIKKCSQKNSNISDSSECLSLTQIQNDDVLKNPTSYDLSESTTLTQIQNNDQKISGISDSCECVSPTQFKKNNQKNSNTSDSSECLSLKQIQNDDVLKNPTSYDLSESVFLALNQNNNHKNSVFSDSYGCVTPTQIKKDNQKYSNTSDLSESLTQIQDDDVLKNRTSYDLSESVSFTQIQNNDQKNSDISDSYECVPPTQIQKVLENSNSLSLNNLKHFDKYHKEIHFDRNGKMINYDENSCSLINPKNIAKENSSAKNSSQSYSADSEVEVDNINLDGSIHKNKNIEKPKNTLLSQTQKIIQKCFSKTNYKYSQNINQLFKQCVNSNEENSDHIATSVKDSLLQDFLMDSADEHLLCLLMDKIESDSSLKISDNFLKDVDNVEYPCKENSTDVTQSDQHVKTSQDNNISKGDNLLALKPEVLSLNTPACIANKHHEHLVCPLNTICDTRLLQSGPKINFDATPNDENCAGNANCSISSTQVKSLNLNKSNDKTCFVNTNCHNLPLQTGALDSCIELIQNSELTGSEKSNLQKSNTFLLSLEQKLSQMGIPENRIGQTQNPTSECSQTKNVNFSPDTAAKSFLKQLTLSNISKKLICDNEPTDSETSNRQSSNISHLSLEQKLSQMGIPENSMSQTQNPPSECNRTKSVNFSPESAVKSYKKIVLIDVNKGSYEICSLPEDSPFNMLNKPTVTHSESQTDINDCSGNSFSGNEIINKIEQNVNGNQKEFIIVNGTKIAVADFSPRVNPCKNCDDIKNIITVNGKKLCKDSFCPVVTLCRKCDGIELKSTNKKNIKEYTNRICREREKYNTKSSVTQKKSKLCTCSEC